MTDILAEHEKLKKQLEEAEQAEADTPEEIEGEDEVEEEEPEPTEAPVEEPVKEEAKEPTNSDWARMRMENADMRRKLRELETKVVVTEEAETTQTTVPPILEEMVKDYQLNLAGREFNELEDRFRRTAPDYDDVTNAYKNDLFRSIKIQNPRMTDDQVLKETNTRLLTQASVYMRAGLDPIQEMYTDVKNLGYQQRPKAEEVVEKVIKPDLAKIAENKARNAGTVGAKGRGGAADLTLSVAASMPPSEWAKLPKEQKAKLLGVQD